MYLFEAEMCNKKLFVEKIQIFIKFKVFQLHFRIFLNRLLNYLMFRLDVRLLLHLTLLEDDTILQLRFLITQISPNRSYLDLTSYAQSEILWIRFRMSNLPDSYSDLTQSIILLLMVSFIKHFVEIAVCDKLGLLRNAFKAKNKLI